MSIRPWEHDSAFGRTVEDDGAVQRVPKLEFVKALRYALCRNPYLFLQNLMTGIGAEESTASRQQMCIDEQRCSQA